jgi:ribosomal protein S18 acetylase RimI-like enzyme
MPRSGWTFTTDRLRYAETTLDFLRTNPIGNTVPLGIAVRLHLDAATVGARDCYGWWQDEAGTVRAAFSSQPPRPLSLSYDVPERAAKELAQAWLAAGIERPEAVFGQVETADAVAADFALRTGGGYRLRPRHAMRLFAFLEPTPPDPAPAGSGRPATLDELDLLTRWDVAFHHDCGIGVRGDRSPFARARIREGREILWVVDGIPVATATYSTVVAGSSRITGVYTPPEQRRRGYAAAVTWAVTQAAQEAGASDVLLHTDLSNPTSNAIYQRLGYRPVHDVSEFELTD